MEKKKTSKFGRIMTWVIGILVLFIVGIVILISGEPPKSIVEAEAKEKAAAEQAKADKKAEREALVAKFNEGTVEWTEITEGVVTKAIIEDDAGMFEVGVYVDETAWAASTDSEKESFAASIQQRIDTLLAPADSYVFVFSEQNGDIVAQEKGLGGFDIKR